MKSSVSSYRQFAWVSLLVALFSGGAIAAAKVEVASVFTDHLVLQRDKGVPVWGAADPGELVTVVFAGQTRSSTTNAQGRWSVELAAMAANASGQEMTIRGRDSIVTLRDVLIGEVWVASGQSNMGFTLSSAANATEVLARAGDPLLRLFNVKQKTAVQPQQCVSGAWAASTPEHARNFSAVAFLFAQELRQTLGCPVGIISAPWGGTPIQTWISLEGLQRSPALKRTLDDWNRALEKYRAFQANPNAAQDYIAELARWKKEVEPSFNVAMKAYNAAKDAGQPVGEKPQPAWPEPQNPDPMGMPSPSRRPQTPTVNFNGMIAPLVPYALRGAIWYQGEANGNSGLEYRTLFPRLIDDWRNHWKSEFPFLFVQLPCFGKDSRPVAESGWPWLREAQNLTLRLPRTAMAITIDVGDPNNVHPVEKQNVAHRLAMLARRDVYGEKLVASGPLFRDATVAGGKIRVRFSETGSGLVAGQAPWRAPGVPPLPVDRVVGFYVAGEDQAWHAADAVIDGDSVVVTSPQVAKPVAVRYGWANSPVCNLYNREGLPASPFRSDDWPK